MKATVEKKCPHCKEVKPAEAFGYRSGGVYLRSLCNECAVKKCMAWRRANPVQAKLSERRGLLKCLYGMTFEQYEEMLEQQNGKCAICGSTEPGRGKKYFPVDHDHETGAVRGILCSNCNTLLGLAKDDTSILGRAIEYLEEHHAVSTLRS